MFEDKQRLEQEEWEMLKKNPNYRYCHVINDYCLSINCTERAGSSEKKEV